MKVLKKALSLLFVTLFFINMLSGCGIVPSSVAQARREGSETAAEPTPEASPEPTPEPTPVPTPDPTPVPTPDPVPSPEPVEMDSTQPNQEPEPVTDDPIESIPDPARFIRINTSKQITITKQPGGELVNAGDSAIFTAKANGIVSYEWRLVSPEYDREIVWTDKEELEKEFPGAVITEGNTFKLSIKKIPAEMNGWYAVCLFTDANGGMLASDGARIDVKGAPLKPQANAVNTQTGTAVQTAAQAPNGNGQTNQVQNGSGSNPASGADPAPSGNTQTGNSSGNGSSGGNTNQSGNQNESQDPAPAHTHSYTAQTVAATCTSGGYTLHTCSCGSSYTDGEIPALGHDWVEHTEQISHSVGHTFCDACGMDLTANGITGDAVASHMKVHVLAGESGRTYSAFVTIYEDVTTWSCSRCGEKKS